MPSRGGGGPATSERLRTSRVLQGKKSVWSRPKAKYAIALNVDDFNAFQQEWHQTLEPGEPLCGKKREKNPTAADFRRHDAPMLCRTWARHAVVVAPQMQESLYLNPITDLLSGNARDAHRK